MVFVCIVVSTSQLLSVQEDREENSRSDACKSQQIHYICMYIIITTVWYT